MAAFSLAHLVDYFNTNVAPFDTYSFSISAFVIEKATNEPVPIVILTAGEAPANFDVSSTEVETTNDYTYDSGTGPATINVHSKLVHIGAKRLRSMQILTMCLFLVNWTLTTASIYIVVLVVFGRERMNDAVLLLPVTIILTIPTLRSLYPGLPPFGIYIGKSRTLRS